MERAASCRMRSNMTDSRMPLVNAYLAGKGDLDAAAAELISFMPLHGSLFARDPVGKEPRKK